jgi:putative ATPase
MIPLSTAMRPTTLDEFQGQEHFLYKGSLLYNAIKKKTFESAIFFGPSGTGKTTLARMIASEMDADFRELNASVAGTKELKEILEDARFKFYGLQHQTTYLYVDEFHRWNKLQQDSLLKALEEGIIKFIGSTTENPYFSINNAVISRVRLLYEFKRLEKKDIIAILERALNDAEKGLKNYGLAYDSDALELIAELCGGDARVALDTLGFIAENLDSGAKIDTAIVGEALQRRVSFFDRGDDRYDLLSALQKSIRGSDPDAAVHYLARLIEGGADIQMICRRLVVIASEDIGMAFPQAVSITVSCVQAALMTGLPEARINLAQAAIMLASSPKSNSCINAIDEAMADVRNRKISEVPLHLKDSHYSGAKKRGVGGYMYPHAYGGYVEQQYMPDDLYREGVKYYRPTENGKEGAFKKFLEALHRNDGKRK